ncbi:O-antigen ligase family protein [Peribacillus frigoritolerans]|uniref:O-antigen ligase family protein n=1 Tax=Peribacillus frigoritolerans TaxID=450367 RepID=UPI0024C136CD|nr:O-antigen ligase family protein [Peribacillus frigoritolerans]WHX60510.1 O-antigen ligase family protein [Peribacillus frigoritolerans]
MNFLNSKIFMVIILFPYLNIYFFSNGTFKPVIYIWGIVSFFSTLLIFFTINRKLDRFDILVIYYFTFTILVALINRTLSIGIFYSIISLAGIIIFLNFYCKINLKNFISALYYLYTTAALINFFTMIINFEESGETFYFLGGKNNIAMILLPTVIIVTLYSYLIKKKLTLINKLIVLTCLLSMQISESGTALVITLLIILFFIIYKKLFIRFSEYLFIYALLFFSMVIFKLQETILNNFITGYLNKDVTMSGRTFLWDIALDNIKQNWLIGYGRGNSIINNSNSHLSEVHNGILEILLSTGFIGLIIFILIFVLINRKMNNYKSHVFVKLLSFSIFLYMIMGLSESVFNQFQFWVLLILAYNCNNLIKQSEKI